jgi:hypothetical protein
MRTKILMGVAAVAVLASLALVGGAQAQQLTNIFQRMLGTSDDPPQINYSERAPLVIPGKRDMHQPGVARSADNDPNWPNDPDEKKRKAAGKPDKQKGPNDVMLRPGEMKGSGVSHGYSGDFNSSDSVDQAKASSRALKPSELQKRLNFGPDATDNTPLVPGQEPPRRGLTDPPPGYRMPLASAPVGGDEPLPSEEGQDLPWYQRLWKTPKMH